MAKLDNFGGVPLELVADITDAFVRTRVAGLSDASVIAVLEQLNAAQAYTISPGLGQTGR